MIVEIGTCDFETQAGEVDGLFIEPVRYYFDKLPDCRKEHAAVSNYEGEIDIYYVDPAEITARQLPDWLKGCSSVGRPHMQHTKLPPEIVRVDRVPVFQLKTLLAKHGITEVDTLKIDAEGHDVIILHDFLDTCLIRPKQILFENNGLVPAADVNFISRRLLTCGYQITDDGAMRIATRR